MKTIRRIIIFLLLCAVVFFGYLRFAGYESFAVTTGSMAPTLNEGDLVWVKPERFEDLEEGDVITYRDEYGTVTHRIVSVDEKSRTVITKGDNNEYMDLRPVEAGDIIGEMCFKIPKIGTAKNALGNIF